MYHFRRSREQVKLDKHQAYLNQARSKLQEILKWNPTGEPDQTAEGTEQARWIQHIREMISVLLCMIPWLVKPEDKELSKDYSEKLKTLLAGFEGEGYPTRENIEEAKSLSKWYQEFLVTPIKMVRPPGARTFSEEEDPAHGSTDENSCQDSPSPLPGSTGEDPDKTPSHPPSEGDNLDDPEDSVKGSNERGRKSKNRIDSDSDDNTNENSGMKKAIKVVGQFSMKLRGQKDCEEISLKTDNPRKRSRKDMESTSSELKPTQTPQGEKILYSRP